jgi:hypothetical protein
MAKARKRSRASAAVPSDIKARIREVDALTRRIKTELHSRVARLRPAWAAEEPHSPKRLSRRRKGFCF